MRYKAKTFKVDPDSGRIRGLVDELDSVKQTVRIMLSVPRFQHEIYSRNFGHDLQDLIGKPLDYVLGDVRRMIREALFIDERIIGVDDFVINKQGENLQVKFKVTSIYGDFFEERSVGLNEGL